MNKAVIYSRVSTEEQAKEGQSIETQISVCRRKAGEINSEIVNVYTDEGRSGTDFNRPALQEMLVRCGESHIDSILVQDIDRLARDTFDYLAIKRELRKHGTEIVSLNQPMIDGSPEGRFVEEILAATNSLLPRITGRKAKMTMLRKLEAGYWPSYAPIGYLNVENPNPVSDYDRRFLAPDPERSGKIRELFEAFSTGNYSVLRLVDYAKDTGLRTRRGGILNTTTLNRVLTNPIYCGDVAWAGTRVAGKHEPLIDRGTFDLCQYVLAKHRNFVTRERKYDFLLRGFIFCKRCGCRYVAEWHTINSVARNKIGYYHCSGRLCSPKRCVEIDELEKQVENIFRDFQFTDYFIEAVTREARAYFENSKGELEKERKGFLNKRRAIEAKRDALEERLLDGTIDRETFKRMHLKLEADIFGVDKQLTDLEGRRNLDVDKVEEVLALTRNIYQTYRDAPKDLKRHYLRYFFEKIVAEDGKIVEVTPNPVFRELKDIEEVILSNDWLRGQGSNL